MSTYTYLETKHTHTNISQKKIICKHKLIRLPTVNEKQQQHAQREIMRPKSEQRGVVTIDIEEFFLFFSFKKRSQLAYDLFLHKKK